MLAVQKHVDREHQSVCRFGALIIHQPFANCDRPAGLQGGERLLQQLATTLGAFGVKDVTERRDIVAAAKIRLEHIAFDEIKAFSHSKLLGDSFRRRNHLRPVLGSYAHTQRLLRQRNSPDPGAGSDIEDTHWLAGICQPERVA